MKIFLILFILFFSSFIFAKEYASWGIVEDTCENSLEIINLSEKLGNFEHDLTNRIYRGVMQAYMSGINNWIYVEFNMYKHLNYNSVDYAYDYLLSYCEKNPRKLIVDGILQYMIELPYIEN